MENNVISGNVFIIPNQAARLTEENFRFHDNPYEGMLSLVRRVHSACYVPLDEKYIEIWAFNPEKNDSNWTCHYEMPGKENFPNYLPAKIFEGKKEGDIVEFQSKWGLIRLKLTQLGYRYQRFGTFEQVLEMV